MPKHTPINYSVMRQALGEVKPGTCYRHRDRFADGTDRLRITDQLSVEAVMASGKVVQNDDLPTPFECEQYVRKGVWVRCADEPLGGTR